MQANSLHPLIFKSIIKALKKATATQMMTLEFVTNVLLTRY